MRADSTGKCNEWLAEEYLVGCLITKTLSWSVVQSVHGDLDLLVSDSSKVTVLGEILSDQAIHVLVCATFP